MATGSGGPSQKKRQKRVRGGVYSKLVGGFDEPLSHLGHPSRFPTTDML